MSLSAENQDLLLRYALELSNRLSEIQPENLRRRLPDILGDLGRMAGVSHVHLLTIRKGDPQGHKASLIAEWSAEHSINIGPKLQRVSMHFFGREAVHLLRSEQHYFTFLSESKEACSKLVSGILRELDLCSYEMLPVILRNRLVAVIGIAHNGAKDHIDSQSRQLIRLIAASMMQSLYFSRRELKRRRNQRQWKRVANGACDFALRVDAFMNIVGVIGFRQVKPPQVAGLPITEFVMRPSRDAVLEAIQAAISNSEPRSLQFFAINAEGRPCSYAVRIEPGSARSRRHDLTLYLTNNDVERAHAEELNVLRQQLDRAARLSLLGSIATEFAHQLTQPLQAISNHLYTVRSRVQRGEKPEVILTSLDNIEASVEHAGDIITSIRDFVTNRRMKLADVELATMVEHAVSMVEVQAEQIGASIEIVDPNELLDSDRSPFVHVDAVQTTHVIINLLVNAIEACASAGTEAPRIAISASVDVDPANVVVAVNDNGPGLPPGNSGTVFDRFFTTKREGFGIGLAICRNVIERQNGKIDARNNPDRGCTFYFTLPLSSESDSDISPPENGFAREDQQQ
jgi:signal transduction histidine kinase